MATRTAIVEGQEVTLRKLRADARDRPRCEERRPQQVTVKIRGKVMKAGEMTDGLVDRVVTKNVPCGFLLDRTGKCWFCGHVNAAVRRAWKESQK